MEITVPHLLVVPWWMMLGEVVGHIDGSLSPDELKLALLDSVLNPIESHIEGFGEFLTHGRVEDAGGGRIVIVDGSAASRLRVP